MQGRARFALRLIAMSTISVSALALSPAGGGAAPADNCLTAPNAPAPQGSRWYYRLEQPTLRKCWRLVRVDTKQQSTVARAAPQPQSDDEADAAPAPAAPALAASAPPAGGIEPVIRTLVTRNVSNFEGPAQSGAPVATEPPAPSAEQTPPAIAEPPAAPVAAENAAAAPAEDSTWRLVLLALALLGFVAGAAFFIMELRRRLDVLNTEREADALPFGIRPRWRRPRRRKRLRHSRRCRRSARSTSATTSTRRCGGCDGAAPRSVRRAWLSSADAPPPVRCSARQRRARAP